MKIVLIVSIVLLNIVLLNPAVIGMPNPSSVYCSECGGVDKLVTDPSGGEVGICVFPNGSFCEEWGLYSHNCSAGMTPAPINYSATLNHFSKFYDLDFITDNQTVNKSIKALEDTDEGVRWRAAYILGFLEDKRAIEPLIRALKDDKWSVRERAAWGLGEINDSRSVEPLIQALNDSELRVRYYAIWALGRSKNTSAIYPLINAMGDDYSIQDMAVNALASFGTSAVEPLLGALNNSNADIRASAAHALEEIKSSKVSRTADSNSQY